MCSALYTCVVKDIWAPFFTDPDISLDVLPWDIPRDAIGIGIPAGIMLWDGHGNCHGLMRIVWRLLNTSRCEIQWKRFKDRVNLIADV